MLALARCLYGWIMLTSTKACAVKAISIHVHQTAAEEEKKEEEEEEKEIACRL